LAFNLDSAASTCIIKADVELKSKTIKCRVCTVHRKANRRPHMMLVLVQHIFAGLVEHILKIGQCLMHM